jgi:hypothetical protein
MCLSVSDADFIEVELPIQRSRIFSIVEGLSRVMPQEAETILTTNRSM